MCTDILKFKGAPEGYWWRVSQTGHLRTTETTGTDPNTDRELVNEDDGTEFCNNTQKIVWGQLPNHMKILDFYFTRKRFQTVLAKYT